MMRQRWPSVAFSLLVLAALPIVTVADDVLRTNGFSTCLDSSDIEVRRLDIQYDRSTNKIVFDIAGRSDREQRITASLRVEAYGKEVYRKDFNPCDDDAFVAQLCPVPEGDFAAIGTQDIPSSYSSMIPSIAFSVPDLDGQAKLELRSLDGGQELACIQSTVSNGKSMAVPAVPYIAAGIAGAALLFSGLSALGTGVNPGVTTPSPTFGEVVGWFQSMAMNGMISVQFPSVYRSFTKNFGFSGGLVSWTAMQTSIDNFREKTGGNLTENSIAFLKNATLIYEGSITMDKRDLSPLMLFARQISTSVNGTDVGSENPQAEDSKTMHTVEGIQAYVEQLAIPKANTFMTVLLVFAVVIASIAVGILLFKVILETWALFASFPKNLTGFRKRYWWFMAKTIINLILLLYGVWTLYCVYQFTNGDSWAAKTLAGVTLTLFTAILGFFTFKIWQLAQESKKTEGDVSALFENKKLWVKYGLFYENYKKSYWWLFVPTIVYMFVKGCIIAGGDGHGLFQAAGQLAVEAVLLILLLWSRPYTLKSGNWINISIQVVRVLSIICILVFVEQLGINQTTKTITGVVLIVMQSVLTGVLAILIAVNALIVCCKVNPHRKRRKEAEKLNRDNLTPLDARNSLLMEPTEYKDSPVRVSVVPDPEPEPSYTPIGHQQSAAHHHYQQNRAAGDPSHDSLLPNAAVIGGYRDGGYSPHPSSRRPSPGLDDVEMADYRARAY